MVADEEQSISKAKALWIKVQNVNKRRLKFAAGHRKTYATILVVLSSFSFATAFTLVKLTKSLNGAEAGLMRVSTMVVILGSYCLYKKYAVFDVPRRTAFLLLIRTLTSTIGSVCAFSAVHFIPLPDFTTIQYSAVAFTSILARIFLKEMFSFVFLLAICCSVVGVVMISRPDLFIKLARNKSVMENISKDFMAFEAAMPPNIGGNSTKLTRMTIGVSMALTSAFCQAVTYIVVKKMVHGVRKLHNVEIIYSFALYSMPPMFMACIIWRAVEGTKMVMGVLDGVYIVTASLMGLFAQLFMNNALKLYDASYASLLRGIEIIFSFIYQAAFFGIEGNVISYGGIALIVLSVFSLNLYKIWRKKRTQSRILNEKKLSSDSKRRPDATAEP